MTSAQSDVLVAGECPVCPGFGAAVFVASIESGRVFFACPTCGCAWNRPPSASVEAVEAPLRFASGGFRLADRDDVEAAGMTSLVARAEPRGGIYGNFEGIDGSRRHRNLANQ